MKVQLRDSCSKANLKRFSRSNMTQNPSWKHQFQRNQKHFVTSKTNKTETSIKYDCEHISKKQSKRKANTNIQERLRSLSLANRKPKQGIILSRNISNRKLTTKHRYSLEI